MDGGNLDEVFPKILQTFVLCVSAPFVFTVEEEIRFRKIDAITEGVLSCVQPEAYGRKLFPVSASLLPSVALAT